MMYQHDVKTILEENCWHALYVRPRSEKKVLSQLEDMGIESYLPLITNRRQWSDRIKRVEEPLFKSYVFVRSNSKQYISILGLYGVVRFVTFEHKAVVVPENQIAAIRKYVSDYERGEGGKNSSQEELKVGQMVRVVSGPMKGLAGRLETIKNKRWLVVYIKAVGQYIPVHISRTKIEVVHEN